MKITDDMLYHHAEAAREKWLSVSSAILRSSIAT